MNQLDDHTRRALCAADQPPPGVEDRILGAILAGPGPGPDGGASESGSGAGSGGSGAAIGQSSLAYALKVVGATLGLAAAGVGLLAVTAAAVRETEPIPSDASVELIAPAEPELSAPVSEHDPEPLPAPSSESNDADPRPASPASTALASNKPARANEPGPTLEAELALMKRARKSGDPEQALVLLERHRLEFAAGVFAAEREVLRVEQLCALGRSDEAQTIAAAFVRTHPNNPLRSRVEPACKTRR